MCPPSVRLFGWLSIAPLCPDYSCASCSLAGCLLELGSCLMAGGAFADAYRFNCFSPFKDNYRLKMGQRIPAGFTMSSFLDKLELLESALATHYSNQPVKAVDMAIFLLRSWVKTRSRALANWRSVWIRVPSNAACVHISSLTVVLFLINGAHETVTSKLDGSRELTLVRYFVRYLLVC